MSPAELFNGLHTERGVVPVAALLLRYCHGRDEEYHAHRNDQVAREAEARTYHETGRILAGEEAPSAHVLEETTFRLLRLLREAHATHPRIPLVAHARAMARVIGFRRKKQFLQWFEMRFQRDNSDCIYTPGPLDPVPVVTWTASLGQEGRGPLHELLGRSPAFNPEQTDDHCDRIDGLRLMPPHSSIAVDYDFSPLAYPPPLGNEETESGIPAAARFVGVGTFGGYRHYSDQYQFRETQQFYGTGNRDLRSGQSFDTATAPRVSRFFGVAPNNADRAAQIKKMIERADKAGLTILVLPEFSATSEVLTEALDYFTKAELHSLRLFVAGSAHQQGNYGLKENSIYAALRSSPPQNGPQAREELAASLRPGLLRGPLRLRHTKYAQFGFREDAITYEEGIDRSRHLRIYVSRKCLFVTQICIDYLLQATMSLLASLGVGLILVSAMTPECLEFEAAATHLCTKNQSLTIMAISGPMSQPSAVFTRPTREATLCRVETVEAPSVVRYDPVNGFWHRIRFD